MSCRADCGQGVKAGFLGDSRGSGGKGVPVMENGTFVQKPCSKKGAVLEEGRHPHVAGDRTERQG